MTADLGRLAYNYAIVGVQKSGTSTLAWGVRQHPRVCKPPRKEIHFFNDEDYDWAHPDYERDYTAPRRARIHELVGDATPSYLYWPGAMERMRDYKPDMPLVAVFRDPLERLFSHWVMLRTHILPWVDWPRFITRFREAALPTELPPGVKPTRYLHLSGIARGYYGEQLERGFEIFPREQWKLLEFRAMLDDFDGAVDAVTDHLGLTRIDDRPALDNRHPGAGRVAGTAPTEDDVAALAALYARDLDRFAHLSGLDVGHWPTRRILDGTLDPGELAQRFAAKVAPAG